MTPAPSHDVLSFRSHLTQGISEIGSFLGLGKGGPEWLTELIVLLANYQEEGLRLYPSVFVADRLEVILENLKGHDPITVGSGPLSNLTTRTAFKRCAPLTEDRQWAIFIELGGGEMKYGVFRTAHSPLKPTTFERLRRLHDPAIHMIGLTRLGAGYVELRAANGIHRYIDFHGSQLAAPNPLKLIREFTEVIARDAPEELQSKLHAFYYQFAVDLVHSTHGTLIAVIPASSPVPPMLSDGVMLESKIRVIDGIFSYSELKDRHSLERLRSWRQLLRKMTSMDGITLLDTEGSIVGYNCFIQSKMLEAASSPRWGGARWRAFDVLSSHIGKELDGAFYRSQDGSVEFTAFSRI